MLFKLLIFNAVCTFFVAIAFPQRSFPEQNAASFPANIGSNSAGFGNALPGGQNFPNVDPGFKTLNPGANKFFGNPLQNKAAFNKFGSKKSIFSNKFGAPNQGGGFGLAKVAEKNANLPPATTSNALDSTTATPDNSISSNFNQGLGSVNQGKQSNGQQGQNGQLAQNAVVNGNANQNKLVANPKTRVPEVINAIAPFPDSQFCLGQPQLRSSDGTQIKTGACSSTPQGMIPKVENMVSSLITSPQNGATIDGCVETTITVAYTNLETGFFSDPQTQYYIVPQTLSANGKIQGHSHVTIQPLQSSSSPPDPANFAFFKGLDSPSADGLTLSTTVPPQTFKTSGTHRICSMAGTFSHQPIVMPVAQRGAQDDCIRVEVSIANCAAA